MPVDQKPVVLGRSLVFGSEGRGIDHLQQVLGRGRARTMPDSVGEQALMFLLLAVVVRNIWVNKIALGWGRVGI